MIPIRFLLGSIGFQVVGFSAMLALSNSALHPAFPLIAWCLVPYLISRLLNYPTPWMLLNLFLPAGIFVASALPASYVFLIILVAIGIVFLPTFWTRVPYYPTHLDLYERILTKLPTDRPFTFIDLGCGFGDLLIHLAKERPNGRFTGIEIGFLPFLVSLLRSILLKNVSIRFKSIWNVKLGDYSYVYAFLAPPPMGKLYAKCKGEMPQGTTLLVNSFPVPDVEPDLVENISPRSTLITYKL